MALNASSKCNYYRVFKTCFEKELYISSLPDMYVIALMKFRCVSHKLRIELGRVEGIERNDRICKDCNMNVIGDEFHFLLECPKYENLRKEFIPNYFVKKKSVFHFCKLLSKKGSVMLKLGKFIKLSKVV